MFLSTKGQSRQYRYACRDKGVTFPFQGAFHVARQGKPVQPDKVRKTDSVVLGPIPTATETKGKPKRLPVPKKPAAKKGQKKPKEVSSESVFKKYVSTSAATGKEKVSYRAVKNPKSGETYYAKVQNPETGKMIWSPYTYGQQAEVA